ncbi:uncharacterized protein [Blastocystis hominis]|uniref:GOST seven transmembrane domain-containing protein n=1 Tax=Blastocystis hominis TaxID=12968 RepID=D8M8E7_BLAHO|nr:uncharacterized protein [Blastocystis hominis]CBK24336.2 unnamed protein product [Blastocystis hominis]|eukprot:XP_012898384.1 uncharacterized protein [Blastocystis hominis]
MFDKKDVFTLSANGPSKIIFNYTAVNLKPNSEAQGEMDVAIVSDSVFEKIGYKDENGKTVLCCDSQAVEKGYCMNQGHILLPANAESEYVSQSLSLKKNKNTGILSYDVQKTGIYYVLAISCDYRAGLIRFSGEYEAVNPYGQLPAPQHGLLPFTFLLFACFLLLLVWWVYLSLKHSNDVMSVHVIILLVLIFFVLDLGARFIHLAAFNFVGRPLFILVLISIVLDCSTRTLTRILTLFTGRDEAEPRRHADHLQVRRLRRGLLPHHLLRLLSHRLPHHQSHHRGGSLRPHLFHRRHRLLLDLRLPHGHHGGPRRAQAGEEAGDLHAAAQPADRGGGAGDADADRVFERGYFRSLRQDLEVSVADEPGTLGFVLSLAHGGHHDHVAALRKHVRLRVAHPDRHVRADRRGGDACGLAGGYGAGGKPHRGRGVIFDEAHAGYGDSARVIYCVLCLRET